MADIVLHRKRQDYGSLSNGDLIVDTGLNTIYTLEDGKLVNPRKISTSDTYFIDNEKYAFNGTEFVPYESQFDKAVKVSKLETILSEVFPRLHKVLADNKNLKLSSLEVLLPIFLDKYDIFNTVNIDTRIKSWLSANGFVDKNNVIQSKDISLSDMISFANQILKEYRYKALNNTANMQFSELLGEHKYKQNIPYTFEDKEEQLSLEHLIGMLRENNYILKSVDDVCIKNFQDISNKAIKTDEAEILTNKNVDLKDVEPGSFLVINHIYSVLNTYSFAEADTSDLKNVNLKVLSTIDKYDKFIKFTKSLNSILDSMQYNESIYSDLAINYKPNTTYLKEREVTSPYKGNTWRMFLIGDDEAKDSNEIKQKITVGLQSLSDKADTLALEDLNESFNNKFLVKNIHDSYKASVFKSKMLSLGFSDINLESLKNIIAKSIKLEKVYEPLKIEIQTLYDHILLNVSTNRVNAHRSVIFETEESETAKTFVKEQMLSIIKSYLKNTNTSKFFTDTQVILNKIFTDNTAREQYVNEFTFKFTREITKILDLLNTELEGLEIPDVLKQSVSDPDIFSKDLKKIATQSAEEAYDCVDYLKSSASKYLEDIASKAKIDTNITKEKQTMVNNPFNAFSAYLDKCNFKIYSNIDKLISVDIDDINGLLTERKDLKKNEYLNTLDNLNNLSISNEAFNAAELLIDLYNISSNLDTDSIIKIIDDFVLNFATYSNFVPKLTSKDFINDNKQLIADTISSKLNNTTAQINLDNIANDIANTFTDTEKTFPGISDAFKVALVKIHHYTLTASVSDKQKAYILENRYPIAYKCLVKVYSGFDQYILKQVSATVSNLPAKVEVMFRNLKEKYAYKYQSVPVIQAAANFKTLQKAIYYICFNILDVNIAALKKLDIESITIPDEILKIVLSQTGLFDLDGNVTTDPSSVVRVSYSNVTDPSKIEGSHKEGVNPVQGLYKILKKIENYSFNSIPLLLSRILLTEGYQKAAFTRYFTNKEREILEDKKLDLSMRQKSYTDLNEIKTQIFKLLDSIESSCDKQVKQLNYLYDSNSKLKNATLQNYIDKLRADDPIIKDYTLLATKEESLKGVKSNDIFEKLPVYFYIDRNKVNAAYTSINNPKVKDIQDINFTLASYKLLLHRREQELIYDGQQENSVTTIEQLLNYVNDLSDKLNSKITELGLPPSMDIIKQHVYDANMKIYSRFSELIKTSEELMQQVKSLAGYLGTYLGYSEYIVARGEDYPSNERKQSPEERATYTSDER